MASMTAKDLYERDFLQWTERNVELLRAGRLQEADLEHIAEEIESMGVSHKREIRSRLRVLLTHLLKWQMQREFRSGSWRGTIRTQRREIAAVLDDAPSLRNVILEHLPGIHEWAVENAADETGLPPSSFPQTCPFTPDQILDLDFLPS